MDKVNVEQPQGLEDKDFPNHAYKLNKVLYGLKKILELGMRDLENFLLIVDLTWQD